MGWILQDLHNKKNWNTLERMARTSLQKKMTPNYRKKKILASELLPKSLLELGLINIKKSNFKEAINKLHEFSYKFRTKNNDQGIMNLAMAYRGDQQYLKSVDTLVKFTDVFQKSKYYKEAIKNGISWSKPLALEDRTIYFLQKLTKDSPNDPQFVNSMISLAELYHAKSLFEESIKTYEEILKSKKISTALKNKALDQLLVLYEKPIILIKK